MYNNLSWSDKDTPKKNYHGSVYDEQAKKKRILTKQEKQKIYRICKKGYD